MGVAANLTEIAKRKSYFGDERQYKIEEVKETYDFYFHNTKTVSFFLKNLYYTLKSSHSILGEYQT